ncbi:hypothetical protein [Gimesia algae]|nr:hypothetical protein [Gimesia algae]
MKFFVLFVLFWGVLFGTALSLASEEDGQEISVNQSFGKFEKNKPKEELKKREPTLSLFATITVDFLLDKSIVCSLHEAFLFPPLVDVSPNCSRAPPLSLC